MEDITVDPKGVAKPLDRLNSHKAPGPDGLNPRVLKEYSGLDKDLDQWVFHPLLFNLMSILPYLKYQIVET